MNNPTQPNLKLVNDPSYRENYANSVQMRVNIWDFFLIFGTLQQQSETQVEIRNFQGIYLSPQQAKALLGLLQQNVASYEGAFGEIKLDPRMGPPRGEMTISRGRRESVWNLSKDGELMVTASAVQRCIRWHECVLITSQTSFPGASSSESRAASVR